MASPRILIVDDEPGILAALSLAFEDSGFEVETAKSVPGATARLQSGTYDLLLLDKNLPGASGMELVREIRESGNRLPVVIMTAYGSAESARAGLNLGVECYIEKPFPDVFSVVGVTRDVLARRTKDAAAPPPPRGEGAPLRILIVSRDEARGAQYAAYAEGRDVRVEFAPDASGVTGSAGPDLPDLLVVDANSFGPDFVDVVTMLRANAPALPLVIASPEPIALPLLKNLIEVGVTAVCDSAADYKDRLEELTARLRARG